MITLHWAACLGAAALAVACNTTNSASDTSSTAAAATPAAPAAAPSAAPAAAAGPASANEPMAMPAGTMNWYGGEAYLGAPALDVTAAFVEAGGGPEKFSFAKALVSMLGQEATDAEVAKLEKQYGKEKVKGFIDGMDFAIKDALKRATEAGVKLPAPAKLEGAELAKALIKAGQTPDGTFWSGRLFDAAVSHKIHNQVMTDINDQVSPAADELTHRLLNQAMFDAAGALGMEGVKLAALH
ncbi:MAG: hypothetical protein OZ928_08240 [Polyangiaceae bacterium]|nr:hypothetical protein [Polyangiaceae bacterium]